MSFRKLFLTFLFLISFGVAYNAWSSTDSTSSYRRTIGYGVSNLIELYDIINYRPGVYLEFSQKAPFDGWVYNIKFIGKYHLEVQNNVRYHEIIPFISTVGLERRLEFEKFQLILNANLFYSMSLRKSSIGGGSGFQGDDYGVGISPAVNLSYPLRENLSLTAGLEYGVGFLREFVSVGTVTQPTMVLKGTAIRNLSFGIRHYF